MLTICLTSPQQTLHEDLAAQLGFFRDRDTRVFAVLGPQPALALAFLK